MYVYMYYMYYKSMPIIGNILSMMPITDNCYHDNRDKRNVV